MIANILSIAGSDPSGGAGVQADIKTFAAMGCYGMAVITALTAQNTRGVAGVHVPPADFIAQQIDAVFADIRVDAVKIGMLATPEIVARVADRLWHHGARNVVVDPVLAATSGDSLGGPGVVDALRALLTPLATLVTPNGPELGALTGAPEPRTLAELETAAFALRAAGWRAVLAKGGHIAGEEATDILLDDAGRRLFATPRIATCNTHGTGCTLSSAIAAELGKGRSLADAIAAAKLYLTEALSHADELDVGSGHGPTHHGWGAGSRE